MPITNSFQSRLHRPAMLLLLAGATLAAPNRTAQAYTQPWRVADVMGSMGIATSVLDNTSSYSNSSQVVASLQYLGIGTVRDSLPPSDQNFWTLYQPLIAAGIKFNMLVPLSAPGANTPQSAAADTATLDAFLTRFPGSVASIEGLNEIDLVPNFSYAGKSGIAADVAFQKDLYTAVRSDPKLAGIPVFNFSFHQGGPMQNLPKMYPGYFDYGNQHGYFLNAYETLFTNQAHDGESPCCVGAPYVWSEGGYPSLYPGGPPEFADFAWPENEVTQAHYLLNTPFNFRNLTDPFVAKMFMFQLVDPHADPGNLYNALHLGLYRYDWSPKPAATAWHNMTTILADTGPTAKSFTPVPISYTTTGLPPSGHTAQMQKSSGAYFIAIWPETSLWNNAVPPGTQVRVPTTTVTIHLGGTYTTAYVFDPMIGAAPIKIQSATQTVPVSLSDHLLLVEAIK